MTTALNEGRVPPIEMRHRLRIAREFAGYERDQLAELIAVSRNTIANAETGRSAPRRIMVNAWAMACGVPVGWILTGKDPQNGDGPASGLGIIRPEHEVKVQQSKVRQLPTVRPVTRTKVA
jgi:DNA-binding XRE family transcriptional regulator